MKTKSDRLGDRVRCVFHFFRCARSTAKTGPNPGRQLGHRYVLFQKKVDRQTARSRTNRVNVPRPKKQTVRPNEEVFAQSVRPVVPPPKAPTLPVKQAKSESKNIKYPAEKIKKKPREEKPIIPKFSSSGKTVYKGKIPPQIVPQDAAAEKYITLSEGQLRYGQDNLNLLFRIISPIVHL